MGLERIIDIFITVRFGNGLRLYIKNPVSCSSYVPIYLRVNNNLFQITGIFVSSFNAPGPTLSNRKLLKLCMQSDIILIS